MFATTMPPAQAPAYRVAPTKSAGTGSSMPRPPSKLPRSHLVRAHRSARRSNTVKFTRITVDPAQMGGLPCMRRLRIPVATVVGMVADGMAVAEILAGYPDLDAEDIAEALRYAADAVRQRELPLAIP